MKNYLLQMLDVLDRVELKEEAEQMIKKGFSICVERFPHAKASCFSLKNRLLFRLSVDWLKSPFETTTLAQLEISSSRESFDERRTSKLCSM